MPVITGISQTDGENTVKSNSAMTVYFATADEKLWDVAKKYMASISEIKAINGINDEVFKEEKAVIIPLS